jgi:uncharacterized protein (TIGR02118 family)
MRKVVHLYKRRSEQSVEQFQSALLETAFSDPQLPQKSSLIQSHTSPKGYAKGERLFDAVEEFSFSSIQVAEMFWHSDVYHKILKRREAVISKAASHRMVVDVVRIKDEPLVEEPVKNIEFVCRRPGMAPENFRDYWMNIHGPIGATIPSILRYEQNHTVLSDYRNGATPRFDGLAITWFASTQAMRDGASTREYDVTRRDEQNFLPDGHLPTIIVREMIRVGSDT